MNFVTTGKGNIRSVKCCVLFDPADGSIQHVHRVVTLEGVEEMPDDVVGERTRTLAQSLGTDACRLELLHVDARSFEPGKFYAVDTLSRCLKTVDGAAP